MFFIIWDEKVKFYKLTLEKVQKIPLLTHYFCPQNSFQRHLAHPHILLAQLQERLAFQIVSLCDPKFFLALQEVVPLQLLSAQLRADFFCNFFQRCQDCGQNDPVSISVDFA